MPTSVTAILVAADGAGYLRETLDAVILQRRLPDRLVVVQLGSSPVTGGIVEGVEPTVHVHVHPRAGFGRAAEAGVRAAGITPSADEWLWLLGSDNAPEPRALERLVQAVEAAPSVGVAGPKQMQWDAPDYLRSYGETMTPWGTAVELAEPELDQAQYDRQSDVLAVAAGGMLVRSAVWEQLGGFDPALPALDDALDFCVRSRLAAHRVQLVPKARVRSAGIEAPGTRLLGASTSPARRARLRREAQLHRRLAYASPLAVPLHVLSVLPLGLVRAVGQILRKQPGSAPAELVAALIVLTTRLPAVGRARGRIARTRTASWSTLAPLRQPWREVRHRRALARDNGRPTARVEPVHFVSGGGLATVVAVAVVGLLCFWPLIGAPALVGGGLLPVGDLASLWRSVGWGARPLGEPFVGPADPFAVVVAVLGTVAFWHPSAAVVGLWLLALPLAAAGGWIAAARLTRRAPLRAVGGLLWAAAPTLLVALDEGRIGGVLVHLAAPFALVAAFRARRSWTASAWLALLAALVAACSPSLLPLLAVAWVAALGLAATRWSGDGGVVRLLPLPLPTAVLFLPLLVEQARRGQVLGLLADPGPVVGTSSPAHLLGFGDRATTVLQLAAGWPAWLPGRWEALTGPLGLTGSTSVLLVWSLGAPLLLLALIGLLWPRRSMPLRVGVVGVGGLVVAVLATRLELVADGTLPVAAWPGAGLSLAWLGVLEAALCGLDRLAATGSLPFAAGGRALARVRSVGAALIGGTAVLALLGAVSPLLSGVLAGTALVRAGGTATVPALVAAEAAASPGLGTLVLDPQADGGYRQSLVRGQGETLEGTSTLQSTAGLGSSAGLARLTAGLVQPSGDDLARGLDVFRVRYVLVLPGGSDLAARRAHADAVGALSASPLLDTVSATPTGTLYRAIGAEPAAPVAAGPRNTDTSLGLLVLVAQALVLGLTLLLALPTGRISTRLRPVPAAAPARADVLSTARAAAGAGRSDVAPEQRMARELVGAGAPRSGGSAWR